MIREYLILLNMNIFRNISIGKKLTIALLLVSVLPLCIVICGFYKLDKDMLTEQTIRTLEMQAKNTAAVLEYYIDDKFRHLYRLTKSSELLRILKSDTQTRQEAARATVSALQER